MPAPYPPGRGFTDSVRVEPLREGSGARITEVRLPAVDAPRFSRVRSRMGARTRPLPPVYQPEVAARAIVWAAGHPRRRRYRVGHSTVATVLGQRLAPRLLDLYLARTSYDGQVRDAAPPERDDLFAPLDAERDHGAHGGFDDEAREVGLLQEVGRRRGALAAACLAGLAAGPGVHGLIRRGSAHAGGRTRPG
ncbi:hypothetical protein [Nocardiopsis protaetiae]|uniref:hypothetical protein n=1 Tax=Nocardiopsis protaetiae TaxID=3382270 RepID=UPI00387B0DA2